MFHQCTHDKGRKFDLGQGFPLPGVDELGLVQAVDGLGERIVVGIPHAPRRRLDPQARERVVVDNRDVLGAVVTVMHEPLPGCPEPARSLDRELRAVTLGSSWTSVSTSRRSCGRTRR